MDQCCWGGGIHGNIDASTKAQHYRRFGMATHHDRIGQGNQLLSTTPGCNEPPRPYMWTIRAAWRRGTVSNYWLNVPDLMYGFWNR